MLVLEPPEVGHCVTLESSKYVALEPESMKLSVRVWLLNTVVTYPMSETGTTVSVPDALFDSVSIPKISDPVTFAAPAEATDGRVMMVPLLSVVNIVTGFWTWALTGTRVPWHSIEVVQ